MASSVLEKSQTSDRRRVDDWTAKEPALEIVDSTSLDDVNPAAICFPLRFFFFIVFTSVRKGHNTRISSEKKEITRDGQSSIPLTQWTVTE